MVVDSVILGPVRLSTPFRRIHRSIGQLFVVTPTIIYKLTVLDATNVRHGCSQLTRQSSLHSHRSDVALQQTLNVLATDHRAKLFFAFLLILDLDLFVRSTVLRPCNNRIFNVAVTRAARLGTTFNVNALLNVLFAN